MTRENNVSPVFIGICQRGKLASYRIRRFDVQIVDTLNRSQPIAPTTIFFRYLPDGTDNSKA
jgi:hypothetical protein